MASQVHEPLSDDCCALINQQINRELYASYVYLSMGFYFDRDDVALPGFAKYFKHESDEEREHAKLFMKFMNDRGGDIALQPIASFEESWTTPLQAVETALALEKDVNAKILAISHMAGEKKDSHLSKFLDDHFLDEQVQSIKYLSDMVTKLKRAGPGLGEYMVDKELQ